MTSDRIPEPAGTEGDQSEAFEYIEEVVEYRDTRGLRTALIVLLALLVLLLFGVGYYVLTLSTGKGGAAKQRGSNKLEWVSSIYGWGETQDKKLVTPNSVAIGPDGMIWTNSQNRYAVAFNPDSTFDRILMSKPSAESTETSKSISPASPMGETTTKPAAGTGVSAIFSLGVNQDNDLYIGDDALENVLKFTSEGKLENGWNIPGIVKMSANAERVAVVTKGSLGVFSQKSGTPVYTFGSRGQGKDQFDLPVGVYIDEQNNVYVADTQNQRVRKYGPSGRLLWDAGTPPDRTNPKTHDARNAEATKGLFELPTGVTVDGNGRVVVVDAFKYQIIVLNGATGKKIAAYGDYGMNDGEFNNPSAIAYDPSRDYFVVGDTGNNRLQVVRLPGSSKATVNTAIRRAIDRPVWILCLPFVFLFVAAVIAALLNRKRKSAAASA